MTKTVKDMLEAANAAVPRISVAEAQKLLQGGEAVLVDVRDGLEVEKSGKAAGSLHISRGMIEFRADDSTPFHEKRLQKDKPVILYCASGGRSALSGKVLHDMGYEKVFNLGGFKDWVDGGGKVEGKLDPGM